MEFPDWVQGPTACATRSYKLVLPATNQHRAVHKVFSLENRPVQVVRNKGNGKLYMQYVDMTNEDRYRFEIVED